MVLVKVNSCRRPAVNGYRAANSGPVAMGQARGVMR